MNNSCAKQNRNWKTASKPHNNHTMNISVFGMGIIGSRCADNWGNAGHRVIRWNRTPRDLPHEVADALEAARQSDILSLYLKDAAAVRSVVAAITPALGEGKMLLNHSTIDLETTLWLDAHCRALRCRFVDAPFTGSKIAAAEGKLTYYLAGDDDDVQRAGEILQATAGNVIPMGKSGNATVIKLATNLIAACLVEALAEAQAISIGHGISAESFANAILAHGTASMLTRMKLPSMLAGNFETHFSLDNMRKDSVYALQLAESCGLSLPAMAAVSQRMTELCAQDMADLDYTALAAPYPREA